MYRSGAYGPNHGSAPLASHYLIRNCHPLKYAVCVAGANDLNRSLIASPTRDLSAKEVNRCCVPLTGTGLILGALGLDSGSSVDDPGMVFAPFQKTLPWGE